MSVLRLGRRAMGTFFEIVLVGEGQDEGRLRSAAEDALDVVDRLEEQLSLFLSTSEVSRLNAQAAREAVDVEPRLYALLQRAVRLHADTEGAFDVALDPLMEAWGFRGAPAGDRRRARRVSGTDLVRLSGGRVRFLREGVRIDLGGVGKGYALDRAAVRLRLHGVERAFLHGGTSTLLAMGAPPGERGWHVGLADPRDPDHRFGSLILRDQALSVSGSLGRVVERDGRTIGHVLDPRTGCPVERVAAWAVAPSATDTDALSTAFLVLGAQKSRAYVERHPEVGAIVLRGEREAPAWAGVEPTWERSTRRGRGVSRRALLAGTAAAAAALSVGLSARPADADEPPREVKVGVVGLGEQGLLLLGQLTRMKGVAVRALCDLRKKALDAGLALAGRAVETYEDLDYMLEEEALDALLIATPTHQHVGPAKAALAADLHVFCEAPLAHTIEDGKAIARLAGKAKRVFQTGHHWRASPLYTLTAEHAEAGALGTLRQVRAQWNRRRSWRRAAADPALEKLLNWRLLRATSGGLLLEHGSHVFDLANWIFGALPEAVSGFGSLTQWKDGRDVDDAVQVLLRYPGGRQVGFEASLVDSYGDEREWVVGNAATILLLGQHKGLLFKEADAVAIGWEQYAKSEMLGASRGIVIDPEATKYKSHEKGEVLGPEADKADLLAELEAFMAAVRGGEPPACGAREGLQAAVVGAVAAEAVSTGRVIQFTKEHFEV